MDGFTVVRIFTASMAVLILAIFILPFIFSPGYFINLDGMAGKIDNWDIWSSVDPITAFVYGLGDIICHQEHSRSIILNGSQTAFCVRDIGIMIGATIGLIVTDKKISSLDLCDKRILYVGILLCLVTVIEWTIEYFSSFDNSSVRGITGLIAGFGVALIIQYVVNTQFKKIMSEKV